MPHCEISAIILKCINLSIDFYFKGNTTKNKNTINFDNIICIGIKLDGFRKLNTEL